MKRKKTHAPQADPDEIAALLSDLRALPAPSEPFDFRERARTAEEARRLYFAFSEIHSQFRWNTEAAEGYEIARDRYYEAIVAAYPPGFDQDLKNLRACDPSGMNTILSFWKQTRICLGSYF